MLVKPVHNRRELIGGVLWMGLTASILRPRAVASAAGASGDLVLSDHQVQAVVDGLHRLADPLPEADVARILELAKSSSEGARLEIERVLALRTLIRVRLDQRGIGTATPGITAPELAELGWRSVLVRVENPFRLKGSLQFWSDAAIPEGDLQPGIHESHILANDVPEIALVPPDLETDYERGMDQWMGYRMGSSGADDHGLEGLALEYQILQLYSQRGGINSARVLVAVGDSSVLGDCVGFAADVRVRPSSTVSLSILDSDGRGTMASLLIYDEAGRLLPAPAHRLEPDLGYQPQVYRADGETLRLPAGRYSVTAARGPEYLESQQSLDAPATGTPVSLNVRLQRWFDAPSFGWHPGDPHIHPEGQLYGVISKYGLTPETMYRQVCGESLSVGSILIWAGGYYYEKQFLTGHVYEPTYKLPFPDRQRANNVELSPRPNPHGADSLIRYDAEQAAFPSNRMGHLVLLGLKNHVYPEARSIYDWPSWNLPILRWARAQGSVCGYAHIGHRMSVVGSRELPSYEVPQLNGLGANECLVDVTHGRVDFVAGGESPPKADLNPWYHLLNCGFQLPMIGETDFSAAAARVGAARTYVKLDRTPQGDVGYKAWIEGVRSGRLYFGDGRSHFIDFRINNHAVGEGALAFVKPEKVVLSCRVACRLEETPIDLDARQRRDNCHTYWHIERARIGFSRRVLLEIVMNSQVVEKHEIVADGVLREISTSIDVTRSSWIALRILPSGHTAPVFVSVANQPVRASRRSAQWCLDCVDALWNQHAKRIRASEREAAAAAWDHARDVYRRILSESTID